MDTCPDCRAPILATDHSCPSCGAAIEIDGKYRLERVLGHGGMGTVWLAHEVALDRRVAIKMPKESVREDRETLSRFEREARLMAKVEHPNLVPVYTVGRWQGVPYIVMKVIAGPSLADLSATQRFAAPKILSIMAQLCAGLQHLHQNHIVHRDVKPANIIVGAGGHVTLVDLGVAREVGNGATQTGCSIGTPRYMAPEQVLNEKVDHRVDIYAAGAVLYELLTGTTFYQDTQEDSLFRAKVFQDFPRPPGLPTPLWAVLEQALAKDRDNRFTSAEAFASALEAAFDACRGSSPAVEVTLDEQALQETRILNRPANPPADVTVDEQALQKTQIIQLPVEPSPADVTFRGREPDDTLATARMPAPPSSKPTVAPKRIVPSAGSKPRRWAYALGAAATGVGALLAVALPAHWGTATKLDTKLERPAPLGIPSAEQSAAPPLAFNLATLLHTTAASPVVSFADAQTPLPVPTERSSTEPVSPPAPRPAAPGRTSVKRAAQVLPAHPPSACAKFEYRVRRARRAWDQRKAQLIILDADLLEKTITDLEENGRNACQADAKLAKLEKALTRFVAEALDGKAPW